MKVFLLPLICVGVLGLTSCGLLRTATQVPLGLLQAVSRSVGVGLEEVEVKTPMHNEPQVKFEVKEGPVEQ